MFDSYTQLPDLSQTNLLKEIDDACSKYSQKTAFSYLGQDYSFEEVDQSANAIAMWLQQNTALVPGDRIAIQLPNTIHYPIAAIAALRVGLVIVNTNPMYTSRELSHQFKDSGAKAIVVLDKIAATVDATLPENDIETVILVNALSLAEQKIKPLTNASVSVDFGQILAQGQALLKVHPGGLHKLNVDNKALALLQYTGGTTGVSKGAMLSQHNLLSNIYQVSARVDDVTINGEETLVLPLPLYHIFAFTISYMYFVRGCCSILIPNPSDMDQFVQLINNEKSYFPRII